MRQAGFYSDSIWLLLSFSGSWTGCEGRSLHRFQLLAHQFAVLYTFSKWVRSLSSCCVFSLFFKKEMELSLIGLQNAGKTSLVNVVATGGFQEDMIPTVGFNMRKVTKGAVTIKLWDLGGQVTETMSTDLHSSGNLHTKCRQNC